MSGVRIEETCSCGATFTATGSPYRRDHDTRNPRGAEEMAERWRTDHRHEFPPQPPAATPEPAREAVLDAYVEHAAEPVPLGFRIPTLPAITPVYERGEG